MIGLTSFVDGFNCSLEEISVNDSGSDEQGLRQIYPPLRERAATDHLRERAAIVRQLCESEARESTPMSNLRSELQRRLRSPSLVLQRSFVCV